jgi:hypothetical protein
MATFNFTLPNGKPFEVKAPPGFTLEQAKAAFDKQAETGSLVGLKPGMVLSAATQAAQGLASAQALLTQAQSGIGSALTGALGEAGGALGGSLAGVADGLTGAVGEAVSAVEGVASVVTGGAATAINTINGILANAPVVNEINLGDFAKALPGVAAIGPLTVPDVTAVLAQAKKLVDQAGTIVTDAKGLGEFGLDPSQLEAAGILKPGMAKFVADGASTVTDLLKSPAAFTGKDAITGVQDLLGNLVKQGLIQQDLMKKGTDALKAFGVPADLLSAAGAAGSILNAAKDPLAAVAFLKNLPGIGADLASTLTTNIRAGGWAAALAKKIPPEFKAETVPVPTANTVNRDTVNAAVTRVLGNPKIPAPNYGPAEPTPGREEAVTEAIKNGATELAALLASTNQELTTLNSNIASLESRQTITDAEWEAVNAERRDISKRYNAVVVPLNAAFAEAVNAASEDTRKAYTPLINRIRNGLRELVTIAVAAKTRVDELSKKREGINDASERGE